MSSTRSKWTADPELLARLTNLVLVHRLSDAEVGAALGCTAHAVRSVRGRLSVAEPDRGWTNPARRRAYTKRCRSATAAQQLVATLLAHYPRATLADLPRLLTAALATACSADTMPDRGSL